MRNKSDPFKTDKSLYDYNIKYDILHLPKDLRDIIKEMEVFDKDGDWFSYDMKLPDLDITTKSYWRNNIISEYDYKTI